MLHDLITSFNEDTSSYDHICVVCGATKSTPINKPFWIAECACPNCGEQNIWDNHVCNPNNCTWGVLGKSYKCSKCEIVLDTIKKRICQKTSGIQGLGDLVHMALQKVGVEQKEGCGCGKTQEMLNHFVPMNKEKGEKA